MPSLTDRNALARNRGRADRNALFLHYMALDDLKDRVSLVNRSFTDISVISGMPDVWRDFGDVKLLEDRETLDVQPQSFDLLIHAMCLHWMADPVGQLIQMRRALKPDGLMLAVFPGGETLNELRAVLSQAETDLRGGLSPRVLPMADIRDLGALLQRAGYALPVADSQKVDVEYDSAFALMRDLRAMGETNALAQRTRWFTGKDVLLRADGLYAQHFPGREKNISATFELITLTGWAPSSSQPQPLRPGSAQTRLADVLGTSETKLSD